MSEPRFAIGTRMLIHMCAYLEAAGWQRQPPDWWLDPRPDLRGVASNSQKVHEAVRMQLERDIEQ